MSQNSSDPSDQQRFHPTMTIAELQRQVRTGASNFYWIAALSIVYSLFSFFGANTSLPIGLALTQIVTGFASAEVKSFSSSALLTLGIDLLINLGIAGLFALWGFQAAKGRRWAYLAGMTLYGVDTLLALVFSDLAGFAFHLFFLWLLFGGLQAIRKLEKLSPPSGPDLSFPKNIGTP